MVNLIVRRAGKRVSKCCSCIVLKKFTSIWLIINANFSLLFDNYFKNQFNFFRLNQQITKESFLLFGGLIFRHFSRG